MRLICPNCGAQYAVADDVIPAAGRDVQCSNCAHTWFETPGASANDGAPAAAQAAEPAPAPEPEEELSPAPQPPKERRPVKPEVADILREEAALETAQRRSEAPEPIESQSDLGLDDPEPAPAPKPAETQAPSKGPEQTVHEKAAALSAAAAGAAAAGSRRELLPDIEEINSNLSNEDNAVSADGSNSALFAQTETERQGRGFRRGFFLSLLIIAFLVMVYVQADAIKSALPALSGVMDSYVGFVDGLRISLDSAVRGLLGQSGSEG